jgi:hypothetical protein
MAAGQSLSAMRASDDDRSQVQSVLNEAYAEGRLTREEWDERATALAGPVTYGDLAKLTADLPNGFIIPQPQPQPTAIVPYWPQPVATQRGTNGLAIAALVLGLAQFAVGFPAGIAAIILGHKAQQRIKQTGEQGSGLARAGLILGYLGTLGLVLLALLFLLTTAAMNVRGPTIP